MNKQIEEMAKFACSVFDGDCHNCSFNFYPPCPPKASAERLYNAGYRKQNEGEWVEQVKIARQSNLPPLYYYQCSLCGVYLAKRANFCPNCGAKMKGGETDA